MTQDIGMTHIALAATDFEVSIHFYGRNANMAVGQDRTEAEVGTRGVWRSDRTRPFVVHLEAEFAQFGRRRPAHPPGATSRHSR